ncbi:MAG: ClbS/DfsB family four-helix bundle protein [Gemmatimonadetes bacterium]|nr:ClbS/DfsB family four-helix bundle protein [Gemmatimonadota bacterium]NNK62647.1 ClbS/DfsB family four-helix bundle protein [Gemmatimonadota bacterium]
MRYSTKSDLIRDIEEQFSSLQQSLAAIPREHYDEAGVWGDDWSINDLIAHLSAWHGLFLGWYHAGVRGESPELPASGYKWNETPRLNRDIWKEHRGRATDDLLKAFDASHAEVLELARQSSPQDLLEPGRFGWTRKNALVTYLGANTASHYRFAQKVLKRWGRQQA